MLNVANGDQLVAQVDAGQFAGSARADIGGDNPVIILLISFLIDPGDAVIVKLVGTQVYETQYGADNAEHREYKQQSTRELVSRFPH